MGQQEAAEAHEAMAARKYRGCGSDDSGSACIDDSGSLGSDDSGSAGSNGNGGPCSDDRARVSAEPVAQAGQ